MTVSVKFLRMSSSAVKASKSMPNTSKVLSKALENQPNLKNSVVARMSNRSKWNFYRKEKLQAFSKGLEPTNAMQMRSFVCSCGYYRGFL